MNNLIKVGIRTTSTEKYGYKLANIEIEDNMKQ